MRGDNGALGVAGTDGSASSIRSNCNATLAGVAGGSRTCTNPLGSTVGSGGRGGSSNCPEFGVENGPGQSGSGLSPGAGGGAGFSFVACNGGNSCCVDSNEPLEPSPGVTGANGSDGTGGAGAEGTSSLVNFQWRGAGGGVGNHGVHGSGGGGGAGGTGGDGGDGAAEDEAPKEEEK